MTGPGGTGPVQTTHIMNGSVHVPSSIPRRAAQVKPLIIPDVGGLSCQDAAHAYLDAGFWPIPWKTFRGNKMPCYKKGWTYDTVQRESHGSISLWPDWYRVGLITSPRSGLLVCDIDHPAAWDDWDVPEPLPVVNGTGREGGIHHLYDARSVRAEDWPRQGDIPGGQVKTNGFIGVPPSRHPSGRRYAWRGERRALSPVGDFARVLAEYRSVHPSQAAGVEGVGRPDTDALWDSLVSAGAGAQRGAMFAWALDAHDRGMTDREICDVIWLAVVDGRIRSWDARDRWTREGVVRYAIPPDGWRHVAGGRLSELTGDAVQDRANSEAVVRERARLHARSLLAAENAGAAPLSLAGKGLPLTEDLAASRPAIEWVVEGLATSGAQVTLPSSRKTGKTTFLLNLCRSAGNGTPFLDRFDCSMDGTIGYINAEMLRADILGYCDRLGGGVWTDRVRMLHCREDGLRLNLLSDAVCERLVEWCVAGDVDWLVCDPWKNFLAWASAGMNDNDAVLALSDRFRAISVEAALSLVVIPMHTTQNPAEDGYERGKGAGELEDGADWLWRYTPVNAHGGPRMLSSIGRGPGVDEMLVDWDPGTGLLSCDMKYGGRGGSGRRVRAEARRAESVKDVVSALEVLMVTRDKVTARELQDALSGDKGGRVGAIRAAVEEGLITEEDNGAGKAKFYWIP